jgi:hypothetical protein
MVHPDPFDAVREFEHGGILHYVLRRMLTE